MKSKKVISMMWLVFFMLGMTSLCSWAGEIDQNFTYNNSTNCGGMPNYMCTRGLFQVVKLSDNNKKNKLFAKNVLKFIKRDSKKKNQEQEEYKYSS